MRAVNRTTRDYVRAMTVVLPTGEKIIKLEQQFPEDKYSGYSFIVNLMIGSEGTLGVITELTF